MGDEIGLGAQRMKMAAVLSFESDRGANFFSLLPRLIINAADLPASRQLTHSFASAAAVTIVTTVTDEDGSFVAGSKAITVAGPAEVITVDAGSDTSIGEGRLFSRTVSFTDPADQNADDTGEAADEAEDAEPAEADDAQTDEAEALDAAEPAAEAQDE